MRTEYELGTESSPEGQSIGKDPRKMSQQDLIACGHEARPLIKIIREKCLDCCAGEQGEVQKCTVVSCVLWPLRMSKNTLRKPKIFSEEQRKQIGDRLRKKREPK